MAQLRQDHHEFESLDTEIVVIGPEDTQAFRTYFQKNDLPFIGISDPEHYVLKLFGQEVKLFKMGRMPAMLIIDKGSMVRFVHYGHEMSDIPENAEVLETIRDLGTNL